MRNPGTPHLNTTLQGKSPLLAVTWPVTRRTQSVEGLKKGPVISSDFGETRLRGVTWGYFTLKMGDDGVDLQKHLHAYHADNPCLEDPAVVLLNSSRLP